MERYGGERELNPSETNDGMAASVDTSSSNIKSPEDDDDDQTSGGVSINTAINPLVSNSPSVSEPPDDLVDISWVETMMERIKINIERPPTPSQSKPDGEIKEGLGSGVDEGHR